MDTCLRTLLVDASSKFYRMRRYEPGEYFGPVDLGLHLSDKFDSLNIGAGLLAGSIFPGSNRLVFTGKSPCWHGFYISSMGGAGLVFDDLGINLLSIMKKAITPSILYLNRIHGEEIQVEFHPVDVEKVWSEGRKGIYSLMDYTHEKFKDRYENDPRILVTGPGAKYSDTGGICSVPIKDGVLSHVDTWAGRGGLGSKLFQEHGIVAVIYGGTFILEDFKDRKLANDWFVDKYNKKLAAKDIEATTKYRFDPKLKTGGTLGVNYQTLAGNMISFNYKSIYMSEDERLAIHKNMILDHYLKQFNEETIDKKQQKHCGEPCAAVCKKMNGIYKKDYEPYQTMGPLSGIFDQRAAEMVNHHADMLGFDAISIGGVIAWLLECVHEGLLTPEDIGISTKPVFTPENFNLVEDSMHNAKLCVEILDGMIAGKENLDMSEGARVLAKKLSRKKGKNLLKLFVFNAFAQNGWIVPNQYWTPGALSPMAIMGKYYMYYGKDFVPPRTLGKLNGDRFVKELILDNAGVCRFHRGWAEEMLPEILESLFGIKEEYYKRVREVAIRINARNKSVFWESERNVDFVHSFLQRKKEAEKSEDKELLHWLDRFNEDKFQAATDFWYEIHKGIMESLRESF